MHPEQLSNINCQVNKPPPPCPYIETDGRITDVGAFLNTYAPFWPDEPGDLFQLVTATDFSIPQSGPGTFRIPCVLLEYQKSVGWQPPEIERTFCPQTGEVLEPFIFIYLVHPHWPQGDADQLGKLLANGGTEFYIPKKGPGKRSIENAIARLRKSSNGSHQSLAQRRQHNRALLARFSNGMRIPG
jgi:hypothetical protein